MYTDIGRCNWTARPVAKRLPGTPAGRSPTCVPGAAAGRKSSADPSRQLRDEAPQNGRRPSLKVLAATDPYLESTNRYLSSRWQAVWRGHSKPGSLASHLACSLALADPHPPWLAQAATLCLRWLLGERLGDRNSSSGLLSFQASVWDSSGREQFHGLGSMYCRGATAVILIYDVNHPQSLLELEDRFLGLTDTASTDCLFAIVGNKVDLVEELAAEDQQKDGRGPGVAGRGGGAPKAPKQVQPEDAAALYRKILKYKMLDEKDVPAAEQMCFETSAKTGHNVDLLFETLFDLVVPVISQQRAQGPPQTVDITSYKTPGQTPSGCCA
ncbi:ras-related protein Rab-20 [Puma concolor]|uniref:Ras-related protein Rab-20 n=1 Tax=Puma concolor TaxID=9696 RepID=A0A6P6HW95_PUMCO|nr:ras-related protein Rab-20 [Puma concolor]